MTLDVREHLQHNASENGVKILSLGPLDLETGGHLPQTHIAYEVFGELNADRSNAVLVLHALTGDTHAADGGPADDAVASTQANDAASTAAAAPEPGWWRDVVGPGRPVDTNTYCAVVPAALGGCSGTIGPASLAEDGQPYGSRFPFVTIRDMAELEFRLMQALNIDAWHAVVGGSMGGARALEWAASYPEHVKRCAVIAATAESSAEQIAFAQIQTQAIRLDPEFHGGDYYGHGNGTGPQRGLGIARRLAHVSYRSAAELDHRFGRSPQGEELPLGSAGRDERGRYAVESYLDHQAHKLVNRFDANAYLTLTEALMSHDVGRGRGGVEAALGALDGIEFFIAAVDTDRLYYPQESQRIADALPGDVEVHMVSTPVGHDGFLTDGHQLDAPFREFLA